MGVGEKGRGEGASGVVAREAGAERRTKMEGQGGRCGAPRSYYGRLSLYIYICTPDAAAATAKGFPTRRRCMYDVYVSKGHFAWEVCMHACVHIIELHAGLCNGLHAVNYAWIMDDLM